MAQEASTSKQNPPLEHFQNKKFSLSSLMLYLQISLKFFFFLTFSIFHTGEEFPTPASAFSQIFFLEILPFIAS